MIWLLDLNAGILCANWLEFCQLTLSFFEFLHWLTLISFFHCLLILINLIVMIPRIGCIIFWICNSWKLVEVSFSMVIVKKYINLSKFIIYHEIMCIQRISLILIFMIVIYLPFVKVRIIINHLMLRVYYLPSEEITFTPKFRENLLNKTYGNWA